MTYTEEEIQKALQIAFDSGDADAQKWLIKHPLTKPEILAVCYENLSGNTVETKECRKNLLRNPNTPPKILTKIIGNSQTYLVICLQNKNCPDAVIKKAIISIAYNDAIDNHIYGRGNIWDGSKGTYTSYASLKDAIMKDLKISKRVKEKIEEGLIIQDILD